MNNAINAALSATYLNKQNIYVPAGIYLYLNGSALTLTIKRQITFEVN